MARALLWSLVGSIAAVITIGFLVGTLSRVAPSTQMLQSTEKSLTLFGHRITFRLDVTPDRAAEPRPATHAQFLAFDSQARLACVVIP